MKLQKTINYIDNNNKAINFQIENEVVKIMEYSPYGNLLNFVTDVY